MFQYNALQTIIQLQSLILYVQTSWFTYTVLLLSLKFNETKCEIISVVGAIFVFRGRRGIGLHKACFMRRAIMNVMAIWRWPVSSCIRHTYYQISTTVQIFLLNQIHSQTTGETTSAHFWSHRVKMATIRVDVDVEHVHACVWFYVCIH